MPVLQRHNKDVRVGAGTVQHVCREPSYYREVLMNGICDDSKQKKSEVIPMYDELIKNLRHDSASALQNCEFDFVHAWMLEAADAIEFLQTYKVAFENIASMGGWWLVGQDKNLYRMDVPMNWPPKGTKTVELFPLPQPPKEE